MIVTEPTDAKLFNITRNTSTNQINLHVSIDNESSTLQLAEIAIKESEAATKAFNETRNILVAANWTTQVNVIAGTNTARVNVHVDNAWRDVTTIMQELIAVFTFAIINDLPSENIECLKTGFVLRNAVLLNEINVASWLIRNHVDINTRNRYGDTLVHLAIQGNNLEMIEYLLNNDDILKNETNVHGDTALHLAVELKNIDIVKILLKYKCDVNIVSRYTPLMLSILTDVLEISKLLVSHHADVDFNCEDDSTVLHEVIYNGCYEMAEWLIIELGCEIDCRNKDGRTALHIAANKGCMVGVQLLVKHNSNVGTTDVCNYTPLHVAAECGHYDVVEFLVQLVSDIHCKNNNGNTPRQCASLAGHERVVALLLKYEA